VPKRSNHIEMQVEPTQPAIDFETHLRVEALRAAARSNAGDGLQPTTIIGEAEVFLSWLREPHDAAVGDFHRYITAWQAKHGAADGDDTLHERTHGE